MLINLFKQGFLEDIGSITLLTLKNRPEVLNSDQSFTNGCSIFPPALFFDEWNYYSFNIGAVALAHISALR